MEIRTLRTGERSSLFALLDEWTLPDGWRGREFFARPVADDPTYTDENFWVAFDGDEPVSCVQIFPRDLQLLGHVVPTGGIGSVFTRASHRRRGLAGSLLERAADAMRSRGMELSLLFGDEPIYARLGWRSWTSRRMLMRAPGGDEARPQTVGGAGFELAAFEPDRDLADVVRVHAAYGRGRNGIVVRDAAMWESSLKLAGNPGEEFRVVRRDGRVVAYVRAAFVFGVSMVTELGRAEDGADALAALLRDLLVPREPDPLALAGVRSADIRAFVLLPAIDDVSLCICLEHLGVSLQTVNEGSAMLRCLDAEALSRRLDAPLEPGETDPGFLARLLPDGEFVFWPADRF